MDDTIGLWFILVLVAVVGVVVLGFSGLKARGVVDTSQQDTTTVIEGIAETKSYNVDDNLVTEEGIFGFTFSR